MSGNAVAQVWQRRSNQLFHAEQTGIGTVRQVASSLLMCFEFLNEIITKLHKFQANRWEY